MAAPVLFARSPPADRPPPAPLFFIAGRRDEARPLRRRIDGGFDAYPSGPPCPASYENGVRMPHALKKPPDHRKRDRAAFSRSYLPPQIFLRQALMGNQLHP